MREGKKETAAKNLRLPCGSEKASAKLMGNQRAEMAYKQSPTGLQWPGSECPCCAQWLAGVVRREYYLSMKPCWVLKEQQLETTSNRFAHKGRAEQHSPLAAVSLDKCP